MLKKLKIKLIGTEEKKRLAKNIVSLGVLQGVNYVLPLLTVPYLVRVLGPDYFGLLAFATALIAYLVLITDYGFSLSATRQISIYRADKNKINEIFSAVMIVKAALMIGSFGLMILVVFSFKMFGQHWGLYFITFGTVIGQMLFPVWLFQGMERMKYVTYFNVGAKVFFTVCVFIFVRKQADYLLVPFLTSIGSIVAGICSLYIANKELNVIFNWQATGTLKYQLEEAWHVFISTISISFYTISTTIVLGLFTNNTAVGYYAAADKLVQVVKGLYAPVSQAIYPLIGKKINEERKAGLIFIKKITWYIGTCMFVFSALLFIFAQQIVDLILGQQYQSSVLLLQVMAFVPFLVALSNVYGIQTMLNLGCKQVFSYILLAAAVLGAALSFILIPVYEGLGAAITVSMVEVFVTVVMYLYSKRLWKT